MERISYKQAAELLGMAYITIKDAVSRGVLTRCKQPLNPAQLLKPQVELFKGKTRLSKRALSIPALEQWEQYRKIAENNDTALQEDVSNIVHRELNEALAGLRDGINETFQRIINPSYMDANNRRSL